jgi:beta-mannanase
VRGLVRGSAPNLNTWQVTWPEPDRSLDIVRYYHDLGDYDGVGGAEPFANDTVTPQANQILLLSVKPVIDGVKIPWTDIAKGTYDPQIKALRDRVIAWGDAHAGRKVMLAFHHEFDGAEKAYYPTKTLSNSMGDFKDATIHFWQIMTTPRTDGKVARRSLISVWLPTGYKDNVVDWQNAYPGDGVVDWIGYDPYRRTCPDQDHSPGHDHRTFAATLGNPTGAVPGSASNVWPMYAWATGGGVVRGGVTYRKSDLGAGSDSLTKPLVIAETGAGMDDARIDTTEYQQYFADLANRIVDYRQIKAVVYWNGGTTPAGLVCHAPDITPVGLTNFRSWARSAYFNQPRP